LLESPSVYWSTHPRAAHVASRFVSRVSNWETNSRDVTIVRGFSMEQCIQEKKPRSRIYMCICVHIDQRQVDVVMESNWFHCVAR
jgi:hypothetical protein